MCCESSNLVAHSLGRQDGNLIDDTLIGVKIKGQFSVVLLDDSTSTLLNGLCTDTLLRKEKVYGELHECNGKCFMIHSDATHSPRFYQTKREGGHDETRSNIVTEMAVHIRHK